VIDLHTHTTCSDGSLTPGELVELAAGIGLSAVAITDHDTIEGVDEALAAGERLGLEVVPGVEIPLEHDRFTLDMLGYFFHGAPSDAFRDQLERLRKERHERNARILERLRDIGLPLSADELAAEAGGEAVGRPHIAAAMRRRGYVESVNEAFGLYLKRGAPAFVDRRRLGLAEAAHLIVSSGGLAVIAHPGLIRTDRTGLERLVRSAANHGVAGIECSYPRHDEDMMRRCLALADRYDLVPTGGSDYHGSVKPDIHLGRGTGGRPIPDELLERLRARADRPAGDG